MITRLTIPEEHLQVSSSGKEMEFVRTPEVAAILQGYFGREGLCLKMLKDGTNLWGGIDIEMVTKVQNVYSWYGLAPRVYGIVKLPSERIAQVVDFVPPFGSQTPRTARVQQLAKQWGFAVAGGNIDKQLAEPHRWISGKIVDFGRFHFANPKKYAKHMRNHVIRYHKKPRKASIGYHPCPELGVKGVRVIGPRIKQMRWDDHKWQGRTVLDIGCNSCAFSREAAKRGARVFAVDHKFANMNRELNNWLGYWNIDHLQLSLPKQWTEIRRITGLEMFGIVICLSMVGHAGGYASWLPELCGDLLFFSGQGAEVRRKYQSRLDNDFEQVKWRGYVTDNGRHPLWVCRIHPDPPGEPFALDEPLEA